MLINIQLSQCTDINLEFTFCRKCIDSTCHSDHEFPRSPAHHLRTKLAENRLYTPLCPVLKLNTGNSTRSPRKQSKHIFVELLYINCFKTFIILFSIFIQRSIFSVLQNNYLLRSDAASFHVPEAEWTRRCGKCSLSGRRRSRDHNKLLILRQRQSAAAISEILAS